MMIIYSLVDPLTNEVRYVGKTNNIKRRTYAHKYHATRNYRNQHVYNWLKKLIKDGLEPTVTILEDNLTETMGITREKYWIKHYRENGSKLTNLNDGGLGFGLNNKVWVGRKHTEEYKQLMREKLTGRKFSLETRLKISEAKRKSPENPTYKSRGGHGKQSKSIDVYDSTTGELIHSFSSILECSNILGLNRFRINKCYKNNKPYLNYKFVIKEI